MAACNDDDDERTLKASHRVVQTEIQCGNVQSNLDYVTLMKAICIFSVTFQCFVPFKP